MALCTTGTTADAFSAAPQQHVAIVGATGRLGREAVKILTDRNVPCTILLRKPVDPSITPPSNLDDDKITKEEVAAHLAALPGVTVVVGDIVDERTCDELLRDSTACLALHGAVRRSKLSDLWSDASDTDPAHSKRVNYVAVQHLIKAAKRSKSCRRIVRITGKGETPDSVPSVLINALGSMAKAWNYQGELALREALGNDSSEVEYTIVRPGIMSQDGPGPGSVLSMADDGGDLPVTPVRYRDVAAVCCDCLCYDNAARCTLTVMTTTESDGTTTTVEQRLATLLGNVQPDRRDFPTDMLDRHRASVRKFLVRVATVGALLVLGLLTAVLT